MRAKTMMRGSACVTSLALVTALMALTPGTATGSPEPEHAANEDAGMTDEEFGRSIFEAVYFNSGRFAGRLKGPGYEEDAQPVVRVSRLDRPDEALEEQARWYEEHGKSSKAKQIRRFKKTHRDLNGAVEGHAKVRDQPMTLAEIPA